MKKFVALSLVAAASISLAACSKSEPEAVANEVTDVNAVEAEAIEDINAAVDNAVDAANAALDNAVLDNAAAPADAANAQ